MKIIVARIISNFFGLIELPLIFFLLIFKTDLTSAQIKLVLPATLGLEIVLPLGIMLFLLFTKRIGDWDITKREQRPLLFGTVFICYLLSVAATYFLVGLGVYWWLKLSILVLMLIIVSVTLRYKISVHITMNTLLVIFLNFLVSFYWLPLVVIIPLVAWSRYVLHKHTPGQILSALLLNSLMIIPLLILL